MSTPSTKTITITVLAVLFIGLGLFLGHKAYVEHTCVSQRTEFAE